MGWRSWNCFKLEVTQPLIEAQVAALASDGPGASGSLLAAGYEDSEIRSMEREHDKACQRGLAVGQNTGAL